jgi:hypothetical protein
MLRPLNETAFEGVRREFERCWPWLEASLAEYAYRDSRGNVWPTHDKEHLWARIGDGRAFFWPGESCGIVTEIIKSPTGLCSANDWLAGGNLEEIKQTMSSVEEWALRKESHRMIACGRRGWLKELQGYHELGTRRAKNLVDVGR